MSFSFPLRLNITADNRALHQGTQRSLDSKPHNISFVIGEHVPMSMQLDVASNAHTHFAHTQNVHNAPSRDLLCILPEHCHDSPARVIRLKCEVFFFLCLFKT